MIQQIKVPVSVTLKFDHRIRKTFPTIVLWEGREYPIVKIGLHHTYRQGRVLHHVFSVASKTIFFKLVLNTDTLQWLLEEISDGLPS
jgi:hypothetical protein